MRNPANRRIALAAAGFASFFAGTAAQAEDAMPETGASSRLALASPARVAGSNCSGGTCDFRMTPPQLLSLAEKLVLDKKYEEARPLVAALAAAPGMEMPTQFLQGMIDLETGNPKSAAGNFRKILKDHPRQTRVRLELARALMMQGKFQGADYHLRLAQDDDGLPEDISRMIGNARSVIRTRRPFRFGFDVGIAPDTNINSATASETVDINFGSSRIPLDLDEDARARSGIGLTATAYASMRLPTSETVAILADANAAMTNYEGSDVDDYTVQLAAGPELSLGVATSLSVQAVGLYRWYGGDVAARQYGSRINLQHTLGRSQRIALQLDGRRTESGINEGYTGWQLGANATYEQVVAGAAIASASVYARREFMAFDFYSSNAVGVNLGIGGELPLGINAGVSGGAAYARYDEPQYVFSFDKREDWRFQGRAYVGLRSIKLWGMSPSIEYNYLRTDSNYELYKSDRHRVHFKVAKYF
jgi:hypothetical protein